MLADSVGDLEVEAFKILFAGSVSQARVCECACGAGKALAAEYLAGVRDLYVAWGW